MYKHLPKYITQYDTRLSSAMISNVGTNETVQAHIHTNC